MVEIGLIPSSTGAPGGKPIGQCVSHYVKPGGRFEVACAEYLASDTAVLFQDRAYRELAEGDGSLSDGDGSASSAGNRARLERAQRERERKAASKTRFSCPRCKQNAWASRGANLLCGNEDCGEEKMFPPTPLQISRRNRRQLIPAAQTIRFNAPCAAGDELALTHRYAWIPPLPRPSRGRLGFRPDPI